jgi:hypothetical protein
MHRLSEYARSILQRMEPNRRYGPNELLAFLPGIGVERLREIMHELWIDRQVERDGASGWRRFRSESPHRPEPARPSEPARPEDLFDHATFADFFK